MRRVGTTALVCHGSCEKQAARKISKVKSCPNSHDDSVGVAEDVDDSNDAVVVIVVVEVVVSASCDCFGVPCGSS